MRLSFPRHEEKTNTEREREREALTMASVEPSINHRVMSPFWITSELEGDSGKRTTPSPPLDIVETPLALAIDGGEGGEESFRTAPR